MTEPKAPPVDMQEVIALCRTASAEMLDYLEATFAHLDPASAATAIVHLVGRMQARHSEAKGQNPEFCLARWKEVWNQPSMQGVMRDAFESERRAQVAALVTARGGKPS
jgi:hypothetical protein